MKSTTPRYLLHADYNRQTHDFYLLVMVINNSESVERGKLKVSTYHIAEL